MPKRDDIHKIMMIGSGPNIIGQASEYDCSGVEACKTLQSLGYSIIYVNSNPSSVTTDPGVADITYIEPLNADTLTEIIEKEKPDAILPNAGGQTGMNLSYLLHQSGILKKHGTELIGLSADTIKKSENQTLFKETMSQLGITTPESRAVDCIDDAKQAAESFGYPVIVRPFFSMSGYGGGLVYNVEDLGVGLKRGLSYSPVGHVLVEKSLSGWIELEIEIIRDSKNQKITVGFIENIDPLGVHTGNSICVTPMQTIKPDIQTQLQEHAFKIAEGIELIGNANIQFALDPDSKKIKVIEINPRASRSSAFISKSSGFPISQVTSLVSVGYTLDEIPYHKNLTIDKYSGEENHVTVKFPRWEFERYIGVEDKIDTRMSAIGQAMGIGKTYKEALHKAVVDPETGRFGFGDAKELKSLTLRQLITKLGTASSDQYFLIYEALRKKADIQTLSTVTSIQSWFIEQLKDLVEIEEEILKHAEKEIPENLLEHAKKNGFSDRYLASLVKIPEDQIRQKRIKSEILHSMITIPVLNPDNKFGLFSTYGNKNHPLPGSGNRKKIIVLSSGPNRIGQGAYYDYCCAHALSAVNACGYEPIVINCNPEAVSAGFQFTDKCYFESISLENILSIYEKEQATGVIIQFGGQNVLGLASELMEHNIQIPGFSPDTIKLFGDKDLFRKTIRKLGIPQPESGTANSVNQAIQIAEEISYPLILRQPDPMNTGKMAVARDQEMLKYYLESKNIITPDNPVQIDQFLDNAIEAEVDAIVDGQHAFIPSVIEFIELAGIHSGDSASVIPPVSIAPKHIEIMEEYTEKIGSEMKMKGLLNIRFAIFNNTVYVLEAVPGASRTVPLVSKICNVPMTESAVRVLLGKPLSDLNLKRPVIRHYGIKEAAFPFSIFHEVDPVLGLTMRSTGQVLGLSDSYGRSFFKAQESSGTTLPLEGTVLFTIADRDKTAAIEPVRLFRDLGFRIMATRGTYQFLKDKGIDTEPVRKLGYGRPDLVDIMKSGQIHLMVNTLSERRSSQDSAFIRKSAIKDNVPYITTTAAAIAAAKGIKERRKGKHQIRSLQDYYADIR